MGYRIAREDWQSLDPIASGSTAGGPNVYDDGVRTVPWYPRPGQSKEQYIVSEAMRLMTVPSDQIRKIRPVTERPPMPTDGYVREPLTIEEILNVNRWAPQVRSWISGVPLKPRKSDVQENMFSGTARNIGMTANPAL
jgi:hypothetical protein